MSLSLRTGEGDLCFILFVGENEWRQNKSIFLIGDGLGNSTNMSHMAFFFTLYVLWVCFSVLFVSVWKPEPKIYKHNENK